MLKTNFIVSKQNLFLNSFFSWSLRPVDLETMKRNYGGRRPPSSKSKSKPLLMLLVLCRSKLETYRSLMAVFTSLSERRFFTITTYQHGSSFTTSNVITSQVSDSTVSNLLGSTAETHVDVPIFLQTPGAKAIAGVFAFASILVTCVQVSSSYV